MRALCSGCPGERGSKETQLGSAEGCGEEAGKAGEEDAARLGADSDTAGGTGGTRSTMTFGAKERLPAHCS